MLETIEALKKFGDIAAINALIPYANTIGLETIQDETGLITVLRYQHSNIGNTDIPTIHGGVVGALLEHAAIMHLLVETEVNAIPKIINLSVDYLRPCLSEDIFARGEVVRQGRRVANVRIKSWQANPDRWVAAAHAHFLLG